MKDLRWSAISEIICPVCMHRCRLREGQTGRCRLREGQTGRCRARKNVDGKSVSISYGRVTSIALDPIEKKPLARFHPGSRVLSVGSFGCNLSCPFCQNSEIAAAGERDIPSRPIPPKELASMAAGLIGQGNIGLAFTYNEPMTGFEYVRDSACEAKKLGMKNIIVTNGSVTPETLAEVLPYIDAFNIDLKCFTDGGYKSLGGDLETVKSFVRTAAGNAHVELTALIVPEFNDAAEEMEALCEWVSSVDRKIPLHITRFFPRHKLRDRAQTDIGLMKSLACAAAKRLETVLLGNI